MSKKQVKIEPLFYIYTFACIYFGWFNKVFFYVVSLILHEYGHSITTKALGYDVDGMSLSIYGSQLKTSNTYKPRDEIIIAIMGPIVNIVLILITLSLFWILPASYLFTFEFLICNVVILCFNILPIYPLDGGRVLLVILSKKFERKRLEKINEIICFVLGILLLILFVISIAFTINYNLLFIGIFLCLSSIVSDKSEYYLKTKAYNKRYSKPVEVKTFRLRSKEGLFRYLSPHYYSIFEIDDGENITIIEEDEVIRKIERNHTSS